MTKIFDTTAMETVDSVLEKQEAAASTSDAPNKLNTSNSSKESEENLEAIKKFIEDQEKEFQEKNDAANIVKTENIKNEPANKDVKIHNSEETMAVASSVMDMILSESEAKIEKKHEVAPVPKYSISPADKFTSGSISLSVGSRIEAKDFSEEWHPAEIVEVDFDEMEVLVRYEPVNKIVSRHDEWISVSSPRLRPLSGNTPKTEVKEETKMPEKEAPVKEEVKEVKQEEKAKVTFAVGERCLARWRDNRRFMATVQKELENGSYEIIFDDNFKWKCSVSRLYKWKPTGKHEHVETSLNSPTGSASPVQWGGPSTIDSAGNKSAFHTHLFDPTRDYLSSKSERREMKRKLNIKEIFNIGQKRQKTKPDKEVTMSKRPRIIRRSTKVKKQPIVKVEEKVEIKKEGSDAVASVNATHTKPETIVSEIRIDVEFEQDIELKKEDIVEDVKTSEIADSQVADAFKMDEYKADLDPVHEEDVKLEKFEKQDDCKHEQVIDRMKEVISKLEVGLNENEKVYSPKVEHKEEVSIPVKVDTEIKEAEIPKTKEEEIPKTKESDENVFVDVDGLDTVEPPKQSKKLSKIKKGKKIRLLHEKKVKKQVEIVKKEMEEMRKQVEEMRKQMLRTQELSKGQEMPESFLLPGEWCCKWLNGQPVGTVSEIVCEPKTDSEGKPGLPRRSVQVEDKRLPPGWTKHMVRRSLGHSAGKWDVVLVSPENRRFHTKTDMRNYLENNPDEALKPYEYALMDFGVHLKLSRRMGWISTTPGGVADGPSVSSSILSCTSPLIKKRKKSEKKRENKKMPLKMKIVVPPESVAHEPINIDTTSDTVHTPEPPLNTVALEDGYVYVGSLKVQIIENLLRCPAEGCFKNFRNNTLLQMHIKHYHRELREMLGDTPKVLDLAYARTMPVDPDPPKQVDSKIIKVKIPKPPKREEPKRVELESLDIKPDLILDTAPKTPASQEGDSIPKVQDSPKLRDALINKPVKRPRVLLPVRRPEFDPEPTNIEDFDAELPEIPPESNLIDVLDFEKAISTHTVTKPEKRKKGDKKRKSLTLMPQKHSEDDEWLTATSDVETRSSFPRSGTPDSKMAEATPMQEVSAMSADSNEEQKDSHKYMYNENGERVKIVHMKREEIINCHCGYREEDGLMVQCELCLCWQHALCHNIHSEAQVPEKYTCSICLNPRRGRRSQRFLHDQDRLYEGLLPGAKPCDMLRRSHELSGNLLRIQDALHALRVKCYVASKKDHPKLYLWAKDWEHAELSYTQEKLNSDYTDLNIMINSVGKENMPIKPEDIKDMQLDIRGTLCDDQDSDRFSQRTDSQLSNVLLNNLLSSPGGASLDLPISTSELETLAKSVQEQVCAGVVSSAPQPEAAIESGACRVRLLRHLQRCHALVDARLDSIEAQVAELESQDPSFEDDETPDFFPRTKHTVQMLLRDLETMEELGVIT